MFFQELGPILKYLVQEPVAFLGGFVSGALKLDLNEDPLKNWLAKQGITSSSTQSNQEQNSNKPQSIEID